MSYRLVQQLQQKAIPTVQACRVLGVSRSHTVALLKRKPALVDRRKAPPRPDDEASLANVKTVVKDLATYGYRRVWGVLRHQQVNGRTLAVNHKRVYRVMRDHGLLL